MTLAASGFGFYELASDIHTSTSVARFDDAVIAYLQSWRGPVLDIVMKIITYSAGIFGMSVMTLLLFIYLRRMGRLPEANATLFLVLGGVAVSDLFKRILRRVRPEEALALIHTPASSSFPSGHSLSSFCWAAAAAQAILLAPAAMPLTKVIVCLLCLVYAIAVGISRVYLGVHYPSDVLAAWLLGSAWMAIVTGVYYYRRNKLS